MLLQISEISYKPRQDRLDRLGQTNILILGVEDDIELPDEDVSQDPQLGVSSTEAGSAAVGALQRTHTSQYDPSTLHALV